MTNQGHVICQILSYFTNKWLYKCACMQWKTLGSINLMFCSVRNIFFNRASAVTGTTHCNVTLLKLREIFFKMTHLQVLCSSHLTLFGGLSLHKIVVFKRRCKIIKRLHIPSRFSCTTPTVERGLLRKYFYRNYYRGQIYPVRYLYCW